jgi:hypothetical protein
MQSLCSKKQIGILFGRNRRKIVLWRIWPSHGLADRVGSKTGVDGLFGLAERIGGGGTFQEGFFREGKKILWGRFGGGRG